MLLYFVTPFSFQLHPRKVINNPFSRVISACSLFLFPFSSFFFGVVLNDVSRWSKQSIPRLTIPDVRIIPFKTKNETGFRTIE